MAILQNDLNSFKKNEGVFQNERSLGWTKADLIRLKRTETTILFESIPDP